MKGSEKMNNKTIIDKMISEYHSNLPHYQRMKKYYDGKHDICSDDTFIRAGTSDRAIYINWISKFISEEISYGLNKPVSYISKSGNLNLEKDISKAIEHYDLNHDQKLMRELEIYGLCYCLYYFDKAGRLSERILNPTNAIAYCDEDGNVIRFIYFYEKKYIDGNFYNVYYPDGKIEIYKNNALIETDHHYLGCMPVSVCQIEYSETIYAKIKELNDSYNELVSNQQCLISEFKDAYIAMCAEGLSPENMKDFVKTVKDKEAGMIFYPKNKPEWLIKNINDTAIKNQMNELKENLYAQSGHIDFNEKLSSNLSGVALQSRLTGLDQRVNMVLNPVLNALYERVRFICIYLFISKNTQYDFTDIKILPNVDIPIDILSKVAEAQNLSGIVSLQTRLERLSFIENPQLEIERLKKEQADDNAISLNKVNQAYYGGSVSDNE